MEGVRGAHRPGFAVRIYMDMTREGLVPRAVCIQINKDINLHVGGTGLVPSTASHLSHRVCPHKAVEWRSHLCCMTAMKPCPSPYSRPVDTAGRAGRQTKLSCVQEAMRWKQLAIGFCPPRLRGLLPSHGPPLSPFLVRGIAAMADHARWPGTPRCVCCIGPRHLLNARNQLLVYKHFGGWGPLFSFRTSPTLLVRCAGGLLVCTYIPFEGHRRPAPNGVGAWPCML